MADIAEALTKALALHSAGQKEQAEQAYREILEAEPECADAWHLRGVLACQSGRHLPAAGYIGHAIGLHPGASSYHNSLGVAYRALQKPNEAVACYRRALAIKPDYPEALNNLGVALRECGKCEEAAASYRKALELKPNYPEAHNNLGIALMDLAKMPEALVSFQESLRLKPNFPEALNNMAIALLDQNQLSDAAVCAGRALESKPNYPEAHKTLGDILRDQGKMDEAATSYRMAVEAKPDYAEACNNLGVALMKLNKTDEAVAYYRHALELNPDYVEVHNNLGIALKMQGQLDEAVVFYRRALELRPDYPEAHNNLANALLDQGNAEEAENHWRRAVELKPDLADAYGNLAMMLYEKGRLADASVILRKWLEYDPENPIARHTAASFTGENVPDRADDGYIRYSFDHFARTFEDKLKKLEYHAPELIAEVVKNAFHDPQANLDVFDAGCGTGWCGPLLKPYAKKLVGIDLSPGMLEKARDRQVYDELIEAELTAFFQKLAVESCDLVASADTLVYFGDLQAISDAVTHALRPGGWFIFTIEKAGEDVPAAGGFFLQPHGRYCHTEEYARRVLHDAGLQVREITPCVLRKELGKPVHGMLVSALKE